ncbi:hypothetical protein V7112_08500 [Bacillus sp. JJ1566]|uniref:hypothetical protein n=1 Tax=Bacillus sp. JJ1566 TaxID=3122961 RepID=UPI002FFD7C7A
MKQYIKVDEDGFFLEPILFGVDEEIPNDCVESFSPEEVFYKPRWNGDKWVESLSVEEINEIINAPQPKSEIDVLREENEKLKAESEMNALAIMELAEIVLGG